MTKINLQTGDTFDFEIESLDLFGQGVSKQNNIVAFIPHTLPGERGLARVLRSSKGIIQAQAFEWHSTSDKRVHSECPYFEKCRGCAYLHTDYTTETEAKKQAFLFQLKKWEQHPDLIFHSAPKRLNYRNRVQLHYDKKKRKLGYKGPNGQDIIEIQNCLLALPEIQKEIQTFANSQWWNDRRLGSKGHIEFSKKYDSDQVGLSFDSNYASEGFSQVYTEMNSVALGIIDTWIEKYIPQQSKVLDLFGGHGNLSRSQVFSHSLVIDNGPPPQAGTLRAHQQYFQVNLFAKNSFEKVKKLTLSKAFAPQTLILDPPRSGFKQIDQFTEHFKPEFIISMSCHSSTFMRDMLKIKGDYQLKEIHQLDFFPSTSHFEVLGLFQRN